jgi:hypothetical protein
MESLVTEKYRCLPDASKQFLEGVIISDKILDGNRTEIQIVKFQDINVGTVYCGVMMSVVNSFRISGFLEMFCVMAVRYVSPLL